MTEIDRESNPKQTTTFANATALNTLSGSYVVKPQNTNRNFLYDSTDYEHKPDPQADPTAGEILFVDEDSVFGGVVDGFLTDVATNSVWEFKEVDNSQLIYKLKSVLGSESPKKIGVVIGNSDFADIKLENNTFSTEDLNDWLSQYSNLFFLKGSYTIINSTTSSNYISGGNISSYNNDIVEFHCKNSNENIYFKGYCDISDIRFSNKVIIDYVIEPGAITFNKCYLNGFQINAIVDPEEGEENLLSIKCYNCIIGNLSAEGDMSRYSPYCYDSIIYHISCVRGAFYHCSIYSDGSYLTFNDFSNCIFYNAHENYDFDYNSFGNCHRIAYSRIEKTAE